MNDDKGDKLLYDFIRFVLMIMFFIAAIMYNEVDRAATWLKGFRL